MLIDKVKSRLEKSKRLLENQFHMLLFQEKGVAKTSKTIWLVQRYGILN
jgi:hypothetical protein